MQVFFEKKHLSCHCSLKESRQLFQLLNRLKKPNSSWQYFDEKKVHNKGALPKCVKYTFYADHEQREPSNYGRECMIFRQESGNQQHALCLTKSREALH